MNDESESKSTGGPRPWTTDPHFKGIFWSIVVEFGPISWPRRPPQAEVICSEDGSSPPPGISGELIYHDEPFYVARDIAGDHESDSKNQKWTEKLEHLRTIVEPFGRSAIWPGPPAPISRRCPAWPTLNPS